MPARVEVRQGSIFDEECDLLVIPCSAGGTVSLNVQGELRKAGLPFPTAVPWGHITLESSPNHRYGRLVYAAAVRSQSSSEKIVEEIGYKLGVVARQGSGRVSAPLLGAGSGDLSPMQSAAALERGFVRSAPSNAVLTISVRKPEVMETLLGFLPPAFRADVQMTRVMHRPGDAPRPARQVAVRNRQEPATPAAVNGPEAQKPRTQPAVESAARPTRSRVFISYSHKDVKWLKRLEPHVAHLETLIWDDTRIKPGADWRNEIRQQLDEAKVAILLVSAHYLASKFIKENELPPLLKAAREEGAVILPVILSPCRFDVTESLSQFQALNDPDQPLMKMRGATLEAALDRIGREAERALKS